MASKPNRPCSHQGCSALTKERYCNEHKIKAIKSMPSRQYGYLYGSRWRKYRAHYLMTHPLCVCADCKQSEIPLPADVVDHIVPHKGDINLFWDISNHQPMAKRCHDKKTAKEDGGFGR